MATTSDDILGFWFRELKPEQWYKSDPALDAEIARRFGAIHETLSQRVPHERRKSPRDVLAAVIVLDQFSRNIHRGAPRAFAADAAALELALDAVNTALDRKLTTVERQFLYMPFQHSEDAAVQTQSVSLFAALGDANVLEYACAHRDVVARFGRFPHRNAILGRASTPEEISFLKLPGSSF